MKISKLCSFLLCIVMLLTPLSATTLALGSTEDDGVMSFMDGVTGGTVYYTIEGGTAVIVDCDVTITSVVIPEELPDGDDVNVQVTAIGAKAFENCTSLTSITLPEGLTIIGDHAFDHCVELAVLNFPDTLQTIGEVAFDNCNSLTSITLPESLTSIGNNAFMNCQALSTADLSACTQLDVISEGAFYNSQRLATVALPNTITSIEASAFERCIDLTTINLSSLAELTSVGDCAFQDCRNFSSIELPDNLTSLGSAAFRNCSNLENVTLPESLTTISEYAFYNDTWLTEINLEFIEVIEDYAFWNCTSLGYHGYEEKIIELPAVERVGTGAFGNIQWTLSLRFANPAVAFRPLGGVELLDICANHPEEASGSPTSNAFFYGFAGSDVPLYVNTWKDHPTQVRNYTFIPEGMAQQYTVFGTMPSDAAVKITHGSVEVPATLEGQNFYADVYEGADVVVTVKKDGYYSHAILKTAAEFKDDWDLGMVSLDPLPASGRMYVELTRSDTSRPLVSFDGLEFELKIQGSGETLTQGTQYEVQYPYIIIKDSSIADNEELTLTVNPTDLSLKLSGKNSIGTKLDGKFTLTLSAWGRIQVTTTGSFTGGNNVLIFDSDGKLVQAGATKTTPIDGNTSAQIFASDGLPTANYTVVAYNKNNMFSSVDSIPALSALGLTSGTDYRLSENVAVTTGMNTNITLVVPLLNLDNMTEILNNNDCSVLLGQDEVFADHLVTARVFYSLKTGDNGTVHITLPAGAMLNYVCSENEKLTSPSGYTLDGQTLHISTTVASGVFHIGFSMTSSGVNTVSATITNSQNITALLGSANFTVRLVYLDVPDNRLEERMNNSVDVYAAPGTAVSLHVSGNAIPFTATTKSNGKATINYDLPESAVFGDVFTLRAVVPGGEATDKVTFLPDSTRLKKLSIVHAGMKTVIVDVDSPESERSFYTYVADGNDSNNYWSVYAETEGSAPITGVTLSVEMMDGSVRTTPMTVITSETIIGGSVLSKCAAELYIEPAGDHVFDKTRIPVRFSVDWTRVPPPFEPNEARVTAEAEARIQERDAAVAAAYTAGYNPWELELNDDEDTLRELFNYDEYDAEEQVILDQLIQDLLDSGWNDQPTEDAITFFGFSYKISDEDGFDLMSDKFRTLVYELEDLIDQFCDLFTEMFGLPRPIQEYSSWDEVYEDIGIDYTEGGTISEGEDFIQTGETKYLMLSDGGSFSYVDTGAGNHRMDVDLHHIAQLYSLASDTLALQGVGDVQHDPTLAGDGIAVLTEGIDKKAGELADEAARHAELLSDNLVKNEELRTEITDRITKARNYSNRMKMYKNGFDGISVVMTGQQMWMDSLTYGDVVEIMAEISGDIEMLNNMENYYSTEPGFDDCLIVIRRAKSKLEDLLSLYNDKLIHLCGNMAYGTLDIILTVLDRGGVVTTAGGRVYDHASSDATYWRDLAIAGTTQEYLELEVMRDELCDKKNKEKKGRKLTPKLDPSGIVYEALESNPLEGVTATIWYAADQDGTGAIQWNAAAYDEVNPQITSTNGSYAWDVPEGWWQVRFSKAGYHNVSTSWMEVPPPRMNLTTAMESTAAPTVVSANAYPDHIELIFSQYMDTTAVLTISDGMAGTWQNIEGSFSKVLHITKPGGFEGTVSISLGGAENYAGTALGAYNINLAVSARPAEILLNYENTIPMKAGENPIVTVRVRDTQGNYMSGVTVTAAIGNILLATVNNIDDSAVTDSDGKAVFNTSALLPGLTSITFTVSGTSLIKTVSLRVTVDSQNPARPTAVVGAVSLTAASPKENYVTVSPGSTLTISAQPGASIFYTTDDTCPCQNTASRHQYTSPITLNVNTKYRIAAYIEGKGYSERININVTVSSGGSPSSPVTPPLPETPDLHDDDVEESIPTQWENPFSDVEQTSWFYSAVKFVYENGLMTGTGENSFNPEAKTSRGMIVTILWRLEGMPNTTASMSFNDVAGDKWYAEAMAWAAENNIVNGYSKDKFGPDDSITREQMAKVLYAYAAYKNYDVSTKGTLDGFIDSPTGWALEYVKWAVGEGLLQGKGKGVLDPRGMTKRSECAVILQRFVEKLAK